MREAYFEYNGKNSLEMGLKIHNDIVHTSPEWDVELMEVPGRDGDVVLDNGRMRGFSQSFPVSLYVPEGQTIDTVTTRISEWLKADIGWHSLSFSGKEGYTFEALCYEQFDIEETLRTFGKTVITFRCKPYKYDQNGQTALIFQNGQTIMNPSKRVAKPLIEIEGMGDITLTNNGEDWLIITGVDGSITVDSKLMSAYKGTRHEFSKMNANLSPLFPVLVSGSNTIAWTGNVTKMTITPRWEAI